MNRYVLLIVSMLSLTTQAQELQKEPKEQDFNFTGVQKSASPSYTLSTTTKPVLTKAAPEDKEETQAPEAGWRTTRFQVETGTYLAHTTGSNLPFWFRANQQGTAPKGPVAAVLHGSVHTGYRSRPVTTTWGKPDFGYGVEVLLNTSSSHTQVLLPQAYAKMRVGPLELYGGRRREVVGLMDTLLSSGSYIWSGNALPLPKLELSLPDYWPARSFIGVKGSYSHGFFESSRPFVDGARLHQKSLYVRLGKANSRIRLYGGVNHQVQWGGRSPFFSTDGELPGSMLAYLYVVSAKSVRGDSLKFGNSFDGGNRVGNHLGTLDGALEIQLPSSSLMLYRQSVYEDGSLFLMTSVIDGLNGLSWQNRRRYRQGFVLQKLTVEYLHTMSQGGAVFQDYPAKLRGRDNYFNHAQYRDGWSYYGRTIGTPFITANEELRQGLPAAGGAFTSNNRVQAVHIGAAGRLSQAVNFLGKVSYSRNAGTYDAAFQPLLPQLSAYMSVGADLAFLDGVNVSGAVAWDRGQLLDDALGLHLRIRKTWTDRYKRD
ncbi:capsule assembly Wzi family protein [Telluribacter humicola]|uniref:capsule assembly Wzi family protein n=1 Tax=Telluribacter humicola TaxID=1720261 RepID=UPI001A971912|nr:capsule assembly Wzi family protein [Telluribacter humicola]